MINRLMTALFACLQRHPNSTFWIALLILNSLLFMPFSYLSKGNTFFLLPVIQEGNSGSVLYHLFVQRESLDPWRISVELIGLITLWVWLGNKRRKWLAVSAGIIYAVMLVYAIYEAIVTEIYSLEPALYAQYFLAKDALPVLVEHLNANATIYIGGLLLLVVGGITITGLWHSLILSSTSARFSHRSRWMLTALMVPTLIGLGLQGDHSAQPSSVLSSFCFKLAGNFRASQNIYQSVQQLSKSVQFSLYDYRNYPLLKKPDIYLIFVESYGSVLYQRPFFTPPYRSLLRQLSVRLEAADWHMATALSEAPTWGGGSWLSYTSTLFGMHIDQHPQYLELREKYQNQRYPSLGATLHDQGYYYVWLSALDENLSKEAWEKYIRLLAVDELIRYRDLEYIGARYGWGPSPPDQWSLHWAHEVLKEKVTQPLFFFTITQNSHYPFAPLPSAVRDWRSLNQIGRDAEAVEPHTIQLSTLRANYLKAIEYELSVLTEWILSLENENAIVVLIGDHQPPGVSRRADGYATPLHILSKDAAFIESFLDYGFVSGLEVFDLQPSLRHEGFYSLFMRLLLSRYGINQLAQPIYLPNGVDIESFEMAN